MGNSRTRDHAVALAAAGAAAAGGVALAAVALSKTSNARASPEHQLIVFLDQEGQGCSKNGRFIRQPRQQPFACLQAAVCDALQLSTPPTLWLWSTKEQLLPGSFEQQLAQHMQGSYTSQAVLILASEGQKLSSEAANLAPLQLVPMGPRPLPILQHGPLALSGPYPGPSVYNIWHHFFRPHLIERWGETVQFITPANAAERRELAGHTDEPGILSTTLLTCDPDIVGELLERQPDFPKFFNRANETAFASLAKGGIFTSETESVNWQTAHGIFPKAFNPIKISQAYHPIIVDKANQFVDKWGSYEPGHLIPGVNNWLACFTADAVIQASCDLDMDNLSRRARDEPCHPLLEMYRQGTSVHPAVASPREVVGWLNYLNPLFNTTAEIAKRRAASVAQLQDLVADLQDKARRGGMPNTLMAALCNDTSPTNGQHIAQRNVFGHFVTLLVAGHETTANTMGFMMYHLSQNPEWEARLRAEIREVLGGREALTSADLSRLVVAEACFKETLRLHPAAAIVGRDAKYDTSLQGRFLVRRGQRVLVNLVALHRNPKHWGGQFGDPDTFNPERFMPGAAEAEGRHPHAFKPFGFGVRMCVGMFFALHEAKALMAMLYNSYTFKLVSGFKLKPSRRESFPTLSAEGLAFHIYPAPGARPRAAAGPGATLALPKAPGAPATTGRAAAAVAAPGAGAAAAAAAGAAVGTPQPGTPENGKTAAASDGAGASTAAGDGDGCSSHGTPLLVLYGSNSGTCEAFAAQVGDAAAAAGFRATVAALDSVLTGSAASATDGGGGGGASAAALSAAAALPQQGAVVVITSTYNGTPPDNAARFARWLAGAAAAGRGAEGVTFAVMGVGNTQWVETFQAFPRLVDSQLAAAGATRLCEVAGTDAAHGGFVEEMEHWYSALLLPRLMEHFGIAPAAVDSAGACEASGMCVRRPRLLISPAAAPAANGMQPLEVDVVLERLRAATAKLAAQAAANSSSAAPSGSGTAGATASAAASAPTGAFPYHPLRVTGAEQLQAAGSGRFTRHIELQLPEGMSYAAGDHLEVLPCNPPALVATALQLFDLSGREVVLWTPNQTAAGRGLNIPTSGRTSRAGPAAGGASAGGGLQAGTANGGGGSSSGSDGSKSDGISSSAMLIEPMPITTHAALSWLVDLAAVPSRTTLAALAELCPCPPEAMKLQQLAAEGTYQQQVWAERLTLLEVLGRFRSLTSALDLPATVNLLPRLAPRYYSISSSPLAPGGPSRATITVALVEGPTPTGRLHQGAASTYLHHSKVGDMVLGCVRSLQSRFRLPQDATTPLILVGPGTGIAPLVAFAEEREALQQTGAALGPAVLFFGCRHPEQDFLYSDRLGAWLESGVLSGMHVAFSRQEGQPKVYVQDLVQQQGEQLWGHLQRGGRVYVCGDAHAMAPDVRRAFVAVAERWGGLPHEAAQAWLAGLLQEGRYLEDVWSN